MLTLKMILVSYKPRCVVATVLVLSLLFLTHGCKKPVGPGIYLPPPDVPVDKVATIFKQRLQSSPTAAVFLQKLEKAFGTARWADAFTTTADGQAICVLPMAHTGADSVSAVISMHMDKYLRLVVTDAAAYSKLAATVSGTMQGRLIHYANYRLFGRQTLGGQGILFTESVTGGADTAVTETNMMGMSVSICYNYMSCTGDGAGNCVGNYSYHSDCVTQNFMMADYGFTDLPAYSDFDYGTSPGGGSGSGGSDDPIPAILPPPLTPIEDLGAYLCFDRSKAATLTVYVDQPLPGADDPFTVLGKMGHAFIGIQQAGPSGISERFLGFYPQTPVNPFGKTAAPATIGNDQTKRYDLKLEIPLSSQQLTLVLAAIMEHRPVYDLEAYNCTDFCMDIAANAGVHIPRTTGWWLVGRGRNPGAMGEDMRYMEGAEGKSGRANSNQGVCN